MSGSLETLPTASILLRHASRALNPRIPPIAQQSAPILPYRIALISRDKLRKETSTKNPDLRRCVAHNSLLRRSMEEAHHNIRERLSSIRFEDDDDSADMPTQSPRESPSSIIRDTITAAVKAMAHRRRSEGLVRVASSSREPDGNKPINIYRYRRYYAPRLVSGRKQLPAAGYTMQARVAG